MQPRALRVPAMAVALALAASLPAWAADKFYAFNSTGTTDFKGVYLAPEGTQNWGPNETKNDDNGTLDHGERLKLTGIQHGRFDVKLQDEKGHTCLKHGVDLTKETSFEIRDADLAACH
jgi:hypothetical protein